MDYENDAIYGPGSSDGSLPPYMLNTSVGQPGDLFFTGIANAALNAINMATGAQPTAVQQMQANQSSHLQTVILIGLAIWMFAGHHA